MSQQGERATFWPPHSNLIATMLHTCCHYCGQQVVGPAPALVDWKWRHRLHCKHPSADLHEIFWEKWAGADSVAGNRTRV